MWGMIGLLNPEFAERRRRQRQDYIRSLPVEDWDPEKTKWKELLALRAASYRVLDLFPEVERTRGPAGCGDNFIASPSGGFKYHVNILPAYGELSTAYNVRQGTVFFDGEVETPGIYARDGERWRKNPWMSLTPMEILSLRPGTRRARGHTVVAGLGLGHQLIDVSRRKKVKKLTVVEVSQELVDWLWPRIEPHLGQPVEVVVGDAAKILPELDADVALIDTFREYGGNDINYKPRAPVVWIWGKSELRGGDFW